MKKTIVFDIGGTQSRIALFENGQIVWRKQITTPSQAGPDATVDVMAQLFFASNVAGHTDLAIGAAVTGHIVDGCVTAHNPDILRDWQRYPLQHRLAKRINHPVRLFNDARAAAWGEYRFGTGQGFDEFLFLTVSTGVGAGLILGKRLHIAKNGFDAEIGEMKTDNGQTLENRASGTALGLLAMQQGYENAKALCDAADQGDENADRIYQASIREIAGKLADLAVMLGIQRVALGGSVGLRSGYLQRLRQEMASYPGIYQIDIVAAQLGHDAGLVGVADLVRTD